MQREVRYTTSADGTRIAYSTYGERPGMGVVFVSGWVLSDDHALKDTALRSWYERFAERWRLVSYDRRGIGASQRDVEDVSLDAQIADLNAVVTALKLERFALCGFIDGCAVAATYAARHPQQVTKLVMTEGGARGSDGWNKGAASALRETITSSWPLAVRTIGELVWANAQFERRRENSIALRKAMSPEVAAKYLDVWTTYDITDDLRRVRCPTLSVRFSGSARTVEAGREAMALVPNGFFVALEGPDYESATLQWPDVVYDFLAEGDAPTPTMGDGTVVILFADIAESTAMTERMGDAAFRAAARALEEPMRELIAAAGGTAIEGRLLGDGVLAIFRSAKDAIAAARQCARVSAEGALRLHLGIHAGDVIHEPGNVYGGAVNIAARIADASPPGEILVSATVRDLARTSAGVRFEDRGEYTLRGIADLVRVFAVVE